MLSSAVTGGVRVCCLLSLDGSVLCVAGELHAAKLLSALLSSVYQSYSDAGSEEWPSADDVHSSPTAATTTTGLTAVCDDGAVSVARVGRFLVAIQSDGSSVMMGQVAHKVSTDRYTMHSPTATPSSHGS